ncbi:MAG: AsmA-like C-terminal region-containing protein [Rikenellaceae bacterium]
MKIKVILKFLAIFLLVVIGLCSAVIGLVATPEFLTPRVVAIAQQSIKSDFSLKSVDLSLFNRFPNITLRIDSLRITQTKDSINDLLFARECRVAVDPVALLFKRVVINHLALRDAQLYVYVDSLHGPLKTFNLPAEADETPIEECDSVSSSFDIGDYSLLLRRVRVDSMQLVVDDRTREFYTRVDNFGLNMSLNLSSRVSRLGVNTGFDNLIVWHKGDLLVKRTSMALDAKMLLDLDSMKLNFRQADVRLNGIDFKSTGELRRDSLSSNILVNVSSSLNTPSLAEFLTLIPSSMIDGKEKISTEGAVALDFQIEGAYGDDVMPTLMATIDIDKAKARYASRKISLENVSCNGSVYLDMNTPSRSYADIKRLQINTSDIINLDVSGKMTNFIDSPNVDLSIKSDIDFDRFTEVFPLNEGIICSGTNVSNIETKFAVADMMNGNYAHLYIEGESIFNNLEFSFDASKFAQDSSSTAYLDMKANEGKMLFGDRIAPDSTNSRTLRSKVNFSGINYRAKSGEYLAIKDIELTAGANFDRTTSAINGLGLRGIAKNTDVGVDSLFSASLESSDISFIVMPKNEKRQTKVKANINSEHIVAEEPSFNSDMSLSSVTMALDIEQKSDDEKDWGVAGTVSFSDFGMYSDLFPLDVKIQKSSVSLADKVIYLKNAELSVGESQLVATGHISNLIRKFFVDPRLALSGELSIQAPLLNITELIEASNKSFLLLEELSDTEESAEESAETADQTSDETTVMVAIAEPDLIKIDEVANHVEVAEIAVEETVEVVDVAEVAPTTQAPEAPEITEVAEAAIDSTKLSERRAGTTPTDSLSSRDGGDSLRRGPSREPMGYDSENSMLFLVPRRVEFVFDLNVEKALFEDAVIENVEGRATIKRGALTLEKLSLEAIGADAEGSMIYSNVGRTSANVAFNMSLIGVDINRIGELMPSVNAMFPMLESFEGIVDFDIKANTNITSEAEIDISTLRSAMQFKGRDLVLMDSETFADLSKTLMFKNKDRNLIDSIEAFVLVNESTVDLLPFEMSIDRYTAIIGGSQVIDPQTFDIDYQYNISIMKSPLPFKAGVDINGNLEDFSFKITTAKLKNTDFDEQRRIYEEYRDSIK